MKHFKLLLAAALVLALGALTSCGGDDNKATNKLVIKGVTYTIDRAMYMSADQPSPNGMPYHLDIDGPSFRGMEARKRMEAAKVIDESSVN